MDKLAYHYNKKKIPAKSQGKFLYYYPCADDKSANVTLGGRGYFAVEVTEQEWESLIELDRIEYNNVHKYSRHTSPILDVDKLVAEQPNLTENIEKSTNLFTLLDEGYTQKELAEELGVTQGYISKIKRQEQLSADYKEYHNAVKTKDSDYIWKCWNLYESKSEMPLFLDVELSCLLHQLHPSDVLHFIYWFYTLGELVRYTLTYYLYDQESVEKEKAEYLSKASAQELAWFEKNYADKLLIIQIVYIRLISEVERRKERGLQGSNESVEGLFSAIDKLAANAKISSEQFIEEKIYPLLAVKDNKRIREFQRFYHKKKDF